MKLTTFDVLYLTALGVFFAIFFVWFVYEFMRISIRLLRRDKKLRAIPAVTRDKP